MCATLAPMHPSLFYFPGGRLTLPELCSARLDGHLVEIDEAFMPADTIEGPAARATALAPLLPQGTAFIGPSAAWIQGAGDAAPAVHHVQRAGPRRVRVPPLPRRVLHESPLDPTRTMSLCSVRLTAPVHTLVDLARMSPRLPDFERWARALALVCPGLATTAHEELRRRERLPGKRRGLALLEELRA